MKKFINGFKWGLGLSFGMLIFLLIGNMILARTGVDGLQGEDRDILNIAKRNTLLDKLDTAIGRSGPETLTAESGDKLTTSKWNALVTKVDDYTNLSECAGDNGGNCKIIGSSKSGIDADLAAGNIKSGVNIFGVSGSYVGGCSTPGSCVKSDGTCGTINVNRKRLRSDGARNGPFGNIVTTMGSWYAVVSAGGGGTAYVMVTCL